MYSHSQNGRFGVGEFSGVWIQNIVEESKEVAPVEVEEIIATFRQ